MINSLRLLLLISFLAPPLFAGVELPADFSEALKTFRADGAKYWGFTQTTVTSKTRMVEQFDPGKPELKRWLLLEKDGKAPTEKEQREYAEKQTRRSSYETAPDVTKQLDYDSAERIRDDAERSAYRFHLKPGGEDDKTAAFMVATFTFHKPTRTIEQVELGSTQPFSPMLVVKIEEARTTINYTLPTGDRPSLLDHITMRVRGRAMYFRSLDEDMSITYSDYHYAGRRKAAPAVPADASTAPISGAKAD